MKPATRAIIILSVLLAVSIGLNIYFKFTGDADLKSANTKIEKAEAKGKLLEASNGELKKSNAEKDKENKAQAATIADLKAQQGHAVVIAAAAVAEGADLKETYDAGAPVVQAIHIDALTSWYALLGMKLDPLLLTVSLLQVQVGEMGPRIIDLEASNVRMQGIIDGDGVTIAGQGLVISGQAEDLRGAHDDIASAQSGKRFAETLAWTFGGAAAGAIGGGFAGNSGVSAVEGAGIVGAAVFVFRLIGGLVGWW
jgi:hypothetical protein